MAKLEDVLPAFREGKKIRRKSWESGYCLYNFSPLFGNDWYADDWEIVEPKVEITKAKLSQAYDNLDQREWPHGSWSFDDLAKELGL